MSSRPILTPTLGYHVRTASATIHGFVTWEHPEVFRIAGLTKRWSDPRIIVDVTQKISALASSGQSELYLIRSAEPSKRLLDSGFCATAGSMI